MHDRNIEQAEYWRTTGIIKHAEKERLEEEQRQKDLAEKKKIEDSKLTITATDAIKACASSTPTKTVSASIRTTSTTTVTPIHNKCNKERKSSQLCTKSTTCNNRGLKRKISDKTSEGNINYKTLINTLLLIKTQILNKFRL